MLTRHSHPPALLLRLAHGKASALDVELLEALERELDNVGDAGAVVLTGTGGIFSAGVDLYRLVDGGGSFLCSFVYSGSFFCCPFRSSWLATGMRLRVGRFLLRRAIGG
jgi:enoyl-CoA hydratase/carnithine racemase